MLNEATYLTDEGYIIADGNSWILTVEFTDDGPRAEAVLTYSQSEDPASPHYDDQSLLYSESGFRACLFDGDAIAADPELTEMHLSYP